MDKIIMLGVGNGGVFNLYNTCFVIQNDNGNFLIDAGGSIEIINRLTNIGVDYKKIRHIFISHTHSDHILGLIWFLKTMGPDIVKGLLTEKINVYCNDEVYEAIVKITQYVIPSTWATRILDAINFVILNDGDVHNINGIDYTFFDSKANANKLYGFECILNNKKLAFLGDESLKPELYDRIKEYDYVMHEAFCLESDDNIFHASAINHSTTKSVSEVMNKLNVKNLILYHTEETHKEKRKELYTKEAQEYFNGNVIVPDELEEIIIQ